MKYYTFFKLILVGFIFAFLATSCTKEGPMGLAGADGTNGVDGNQSCLACHSQANMNAVETQYAASSHANPGFELGYAGIRQGCMECHSNEGFTSYTVGNYPSSNISFASKISCGTCHGDHKSLEEGISAPMRTMASVLSKADGVTIFDFEGSSNTCANCHQSRVNGSFYADVDSVWNNDGSFAFLVHADSVYLSSTHASPHYATMTNNIFGVGGYANEAGKVMGAHKTAGCVGCHMGEAESGKTNGGHTMVASLTSCKTCHSNATNFDIGGVQTKTDKAEEDIAKALVLKGILDESHNAVVGIYHKDVFEAYWNYKIIHYDGSSGVHNPKYTEVLLNHAKVKLGL